MSLASQGRTRVIKTHLSFILTLLRTHSKMATEQTYSLIQALVNRLKDGSQLLQVLHDEHPNILGDLDKYMTRQTNGLEVTHDEVCSLPLYIAPVLMI